MSTPEIRVLLADDQPLIRAGLAAVIDSAPDMTVVGQAADGASLVSLARSTLADVALVDVRMPGLDGISAIGIMADDPDLAGVKAIVLTTFETQDHVLRAVRAGAAGFLSKSMEPSEILAAIRKGMAGDTPMSPIATRSLVEQLSRVGARAVVDHSLVASLTERETEVVALVGRGLSNQEIGDRLFLSPLTVKTHANRAMVKLGASDRAQLVVVAYEAGLVRPGLRDDASS